MEFEGTNQTYDQPGTGQMQKPSPEPVDNQLAKELEQRAQYAANEASWFEESARRHRAVESACSAALERLNAPQQQPSPVQY